MAWLPLPLLHGACIYYVVSRHIALHARPPDWSLFTQVVIGVTAPRAGPLAGGMNGHHAIWVSQQAPEESPALCSASPLMPCPAIECLGLQPPAALACLFPSALPRQITRGQENLAQMSSVVAPWVHDLAIENCECATALPGTPGVSSLAADCPAHSYALGCRRHTQRVFCHQRI